MITPDAIEQLRLAGVTSTSADIGPTDARAILDLLEATQKWRDALPNLSYTDIRRRLIDDLMAGAINTAFPK